VGGSIPVRFISSDFATRGAAFILARYGLPRRSLSIYHQANVALAVAFGNIAVALACGRRRVMSAQHVRVFLSDGSLPAIFVNVVLDLAATAD
jgi:hypothetical protein